MTGNRVLARETLPNFPCPYTMDGHCQDECAAEHERTCDVLPIHRDYLALREVVVAVLGDMTTEEAAFAYRSIASEAWSHPFLRNDQQFLTLADAVEGLACQE